MTTPRGRTVIATNSLLIVCKAEFRDAMNVSLASIDTGGSTDVLNIPLVVPGDATNTPVAYWTHWSMDDSQRSSMNQMFAQQGWRPLRGTEGTVLGPTDSVPEFSTNQRWWVWNGETTPNSRALSTLGLTPIDASED